MITWAYIAGFLDGDGWITVSKNNKEKSMIPHICPVCHGDVIIEVMKERGLI